MKQIAAVLLLIALLTSTGCAPQDPADPGASARPAAPAAPEEAGGTVPTAGQTTAVQKEMADLAEGRWTDHSAVWSADSGKFLLTATATEDAGADAIKSYCRLLDDLAARQLPGINISAAVYFPSGAKIECK
jgi:hypothetical protein